MLFLALQWLPRYANESETNIRVEIVNCGNVSPSQTLVNCGNVSQGLGRETVLLLHCARRHRAPAYI